MSEPVGSAASLFAGNPEGTGGAPAPAPTGAPPAPASTGSDFFKDFDPQTREFVEKKGWKSSSDLVGSYQNLEKLLGGEKVPVPKGPEDKAAYDLMYKALGRPDAPDGYALDKREGIDPQFAKAAQEAFHGLGLSSQQAQGLADWFDGQGKSAQQAQEEKFAQESQIDFQKIQREWGKEFDVKAEFGRRAIRQFGLDQESTAKIERALGTKATLELFAKIGESFNEAPMRGNNSPMESQILTPALAEQKIQALKLDPEFSARYMKGHPAAREEMDRLVRIAAGA
jgi:hypothetical protein